MALRATFHPTDWPMLARRSGQFVLFETRRLVAIADTINLGGALMLDLDEHRDLEKLDIHGTRGLPLRYSSPKRGERYLRLRLAGSPSRDLIVRTVKAAGEARLSWSNCTVDQVVSLGPDIEALVADDELVGFRVALDC